MRPDLSEPVLQKMIENASAEIERIEGLRRELLTAVNENGMQQAGILSRARQANENHDRSEQGLKVMKRLVAKQRIRSVAAKETDIEQDEATTLEAAQADRDAAVVALQEARARKNETDLQLADLDALRTQEKDMRAQLAELADERLEAIALRDELEQSIGERKKEREKREKE